MSASRPMRYVAAGVAAVALAFGAYAIGNSNSSTSSTGVASASGAAGAAAPGAGQAPGARAPGGGQLPGNGQAPPGFGTPATGAAARKARAAALARYKGSVERVDQLPDGSYVVHVITSTTEYHVHVSRGFKVTGADQGGPGGGPPGLGGGPSGEGGANGAGPSGAAPQTGTSGPPGATN